VRRHSGDVLIAVVVVVLMGVMPYFYSNELLLFNFITFLALAQGLNIIYGFTGYLPFGYVGFYGAGAYGFALAVMHLHVPALIAMLLGGVAALVLAVVLLPLLRLSGTSGLRGYRQPGIGGCHQGTVWRVVAGRICAAPFLFRRVGDPRRDTGAGDLAA